MDSLQNQYFKRSKLRTRLGIFPDTEELWEVGWGGASANRLPSCSP